MMMMMVMMMMMMIMIIIIITIIKDVFLILSSFYTYKTIKNPLLKMICDPV